MFRRNNSRGEDGVNLARKVGTRVAMATSMLSITAGSALLAASPASAHETSIRVGDAVGTVGAAHSGVRICELSPGRPGVGYIQYRTPNGSGGMLAADGCNTTQVGDSGGVVAYRVGWDQGGGTLWSAWRAP
jgi:hypothetical protein